MTNPLSTVFDFFIGFFDYLPQPLLAFLSFVSILFIVGTIIRWLL